MPQEGRTPPTESTGIREEGLGVTLSDMSVSRQKEAHKGIRRQVEAVKEGKERPED